LRDSIHSVREVLDTGFGSAVQLRIDLDDGLWPVMVDPAELETALVNLIINARDAMPGGGSVTVRARNTQIDDGVRKGDHVVIEVKDTGVGIPPDIIGKVFDPFFTTKPIGKGTGLGLSQVHGFAHQAGGTVAVASELGTGTTFAICLPRGKRKAELLEDEVRSIGSGTVLLVEDNPEVASVSAGLLEQLGYTVRRVANAEAALREIELDGVDLVFSDIVMPGKMDGLGLARHLKATKPGLPILLASGYSDAALSVRGDFPILRKPYEIHELSQAIAKLPR
jgi:CheY-like chemotaxis protein/rRNA processing protein Gar1